jgi:hypothetical protein
LEARIMNIRPTPVNALDVNGVAGKIRVIFIPKGTREPNFENLDPNIKEHLVSFYDLRYPHTPDGQFTGGRYYVSTLLAHTAPGVGLILHGGVPDWAIEGPEMDKVRNFLKEQI